MPESDALQSPFCGNLRSKKFFLRDQLATEAEHYLDASNHCWCFHTQQAIGPDGRSVQPEICTPERNCYQSSI
jgi:hypothetical protein